MAVKLLGSKDCNQIFEMYMYTGIRKIKYMNVFGIFCIVYTSVFENMLHHQILVSLMIASTGGLLADELPVLLLIEVAREQFCQ